MPSVTSSSIACVRAPLSTIDTDLLVVPWFEAEVPDRFGELDRLTAGEVARTLATKEFAAKPFDLFMTPVVDRSWKARRVALIGAGREGAFEMGLARKLATAIALVARQRRIESLAFVMRPGLPDPSGDVDVASIRPPGRGAVRYVLSAATPTMTISASNTQRAERQRCTTVGPTAESS